MSDSGSKKSNRRKPNHRPQIDENLDELDIPRFYVLETIKNNQLIDRRGFLTTSAICIGGFLIGCKEDPPTTPPTSDPILHELPYSIDAHYGAFDCKVNPDGKSISSFGVTNDVVKIKKWDFPSGKLLDKLPYEEGIGFNIHCCFNSSGDLFFISKNCKIDVYDWESLQHTSTISMPVLILNMNSAMQAVVKYYSNDGYNREIRDIATNTVLRSLPRPENDDNDHYFINNDIGLSPDGHWAFLRREKGGGRIDIEFLSLLQPEDDRILTFDHEGGWSNGSAMRDSIFSIDNRYFVTAWNISSSRTKLVIWNLESTEPSPIAAYHTTNGRILSYTFSHDSSQIVALVENDDFTSKRVETIDASSGSVIHSAPFPTNSYPVGRSIKLSSDGSALIVSGLVGRSDNRHGIIRYYDIATLELIADLFDPVDTLKKCGKIKYYSLVNDNGQEIMYTTSNLNQLPNGSICSCDYVEGERLTCAHCSHCGADGGCIPVCICVPV